MVQNTLKRTIFLFLSILPIVVLFFFYTQSKEPFVVQNESDATAAERNTQISESIQSDSTTSHAELQEFLRTESEIKNIPVKSVQIIESVPPTVILVTTISITTDDQDTKNQEIQVLLDADPMVIATQLHRLELVLKGVDFSEMSEEIEEIDVRFKLPVLRIQKSSISS